MKLKKKAKIILICIITVITYVLMAFIGAFNDVSIVGSIFILFGWYWLLAGQIIWLYKLWRN